MKTEDYVLLADTLDAMADLSMDTYGREFKTMRDAAKALRESVSMLHTLMRDVQTTLALLAKRTEECESLRAQLSEAQARLAAWPASKESLKGERELAEYAYSVTAHDFERNPIGSRDWTLFWSGWQRNNEARNEAAPVSPAAQVAQPVADAEADDENRRCITCTYKDCSAIAEPCYSCVSEAFRTGEAFTKWQKGAA